MKKRLTIIGTMLVLGLCGCSQGVSPEEYNKLNQKYESTVEEYGNLEAKYNELDKQYQELKQKYLDDLDQEANDLVADLPLSYANAWIESAFSSNGSCCILGDTLSVSIFTDDDISTEVVNSLWKETLSAMKVYTAVSTSSPDSFPFNYIAISFFDKDKNGIFQLTIHCEDNTLGDVVINSAHMQEILTALSSN